MPPGIPIPPEVDILSIVVCDNEPDRNPLPPGNNVLDSFLSVLSPAPLGSTGPLNLQVTCNLTEASPREVKFKLTLMTQAGFRLVTGNNGKDANYVRQVTSGEAVFLQFEVQNTLPLDQVIRLISLRLTAKDSSPKSAGADNKTVAIETNQLIMKKSPLLLTLLTALLNFGCGKEDATQVPQDQIIKLTVTTDTNNIKANGQTLITLKAVVPANVTDDFRNITFTSSTGLGTFAGSANGASNVVAVDASGVATTTIKVSTAPGLYYVAAQVGPAAKPYKTPDIPIALHTLTFADKLTFTADNTTPVADGLSIVTLSVTSQFETDATITLATNQGSFLQAPSAATYSMPLDQNGKGTTQLKMGNLITPYVISATFTDKTTASIILNPQPSLPDTIFVDPTALIVDPAGAADPIKVFLGKSNTNAKVSQNTPVSYLAYQLNGTAQKSVGRFTGLNAAVSDPNGTVAAVNFYGDTGDIDGVKPIYIEVSAFKTATIKTKTTIQLKLKQ